MSPMPKRLLGSLLTAATALTLLCSQDVAAKMSGSNAITPHNYIDMGADALANNPPSCGMPYGTLDIGRITAVQAMNTGSECGTCLRVVAKKSDCGATPPIPYKDYNGSIDTDKFLDDQANYQSNQLASLAAGKHRRGQYHQRRHNVKRDGGDDGEYRWVYVLAVDTGGQGLDMSLVSFTALFQQPSNPAQATWSPVDKSFCYGIQRNKREEGSQSHSTVKQIKVYTGSDPDSHDPTSDNNSSNDIGDKKDDDNGSQKQEQQQQPPSQSNKSAVTTNNPIKNNADNDKDSSSSPDNNNSSNNSEVPKQQDQNLRNGGAPNNNTNATTLPGVNGGVAVGGQTNQNQNSTSPSKLADNSNSNGGSSDQEGSATPSHFYQSNFNALSTAISASCLAIVMMSLF
ncbi:hypothetical protein H4219_005167 [Mycoemilia scoparia]|uniref:Expansin-like EG45 domain-containing protein n=1 Tax=Mycoemilia scoparia TaxID=417184 RepID=A0A9W7ZU06_9FUNG|nr:hypothetical protein H4219_005167 [Mycoemilia scoparia]